MKTQHSKKKHGMDKTNRNTLYILLLLALVAAGSLLGTYFALNENAKTMGTELIRSYAAEESRFISTYQTIVKIGMSYLEDNVEANPDSEAMEKRMFRFFEWAREAAGDYEIHCHAIIDGKIISEYEEDVPEDYDYKQSVWYQEIQNAKEDVVFTNAYESVIDGSQVVSVAAVNDETGDIIVVDLLPEDFERNHVPWKLIETGCYYLCDSKGNLLYYYSPEEINEESLEAYAREISRRIDSGEYETAGSAYQKGMDSQSRSVYYCQSENGWLSIMTISSAVLFSGMEHILWMYFFIFGSVIVLGAIWWKRDRKLARVVERTNDTIRVLGNSYYAIYRLNVIYGTYEMVKGSDYIREHLEYEGVYEALLQGLVSVMDEDTGRDFAENFSLKNLRKLAEERVSDFGGDFRRSFNGTYRWINVRLLLDESLNQGEMVLCFRMAEDEKQRQLQHIRLMEEALAAADASEKSQMQFFSNMSHDMRTPLNVIINLAELARRPGCEEDKRMEYLEKIDLSSRQLLVLINDILDMSRLAQGRVTLEDKTFDVCEEVRACAMPFQDQAHNEGKKFDLKIDVRDCVVSGDPFRLTQILNNLISNALKFTRTGDRITVSLRQNKGQKSNYLFTVEDTGIGMSEEFLPRLFDPYEREVRFGTKSVIGTGLGMPIVKNLVSQMGGQITVESTLGKGSRFIVSLPFEAGEHLPEVKEQSAFGGSLEGYQILLVDDNLLNLEIATELLKEQGLEVQQATNGREAVRVFSESAEFFFDAVLMDMQMPEMDGCQAAQAIRALNRADAGTVPIIALTANAFAEDIARTAQAGMDAHLSKPIDMNMLCSTLEGLIGRPD